MMNERWAFIIEEEDIDDIRYYRNVLTKSNLRLKQYINDEYMDIESLVITQMQALYKIELEIPNDQAHEILIHEINRAIELSNKWLVGIAMNYISTDPMIQNVMTDIREKLDTINWAVIELDYNKLRDQSEWLRRELSEYIYHPLRIQKWIEAGFDLGMYMP